MSNHITDQEFLKIVQDKLGFLEEERYRKYKSLKRRKMIKFIFFALFLAIAIYFGVYFREKYGFDIDNYSEEIEKIFGLSVVGFVVTAVFLSTLIQYFENSPKTKYKKNFKTLVMPELARILGGFQYKYKDHIDMWQMKKSKIIPPHEKMKCSDVFRGTYKGVNVEFAEIYLYNELKNKKGKNLKICKFQGFYVLLDVVHTKFNGHTVLNNDKDKFLGIYKDGIVGLKKAGMADPEFEKVFDVYTDDQVEARYLLDPVMIEKITKLYHDFHGTGLYAAFYDSKLLIMISSGHDHFEAEDIETPIFDAHSLLQIKHDIDNVTGIIDKLSLYNPDHSDGDTRTDSNIESVEQENTHEEIAEKAQPDIDEEVSEHNYNF